MGWGVSLRSCLTFHRDVLDSKPQDDGPDHAQRHLRVAIYDLCRQGRGWGDRVVTPGYPTSAHPLGAPPAPPGPHLTGRRPDSLVTKDTAAGPQPSPYMGFLVPEGAGPSGGLASEACPAAFPIL